MSISCGSDTPTPPPPVLTTIDVSLPATTIATGQSITAVVAGRDQNNASIATGDITWSSSAPTIVAVSATGVVKGVGAGTAQITATAGIKTGQVTVTVSPLPGIKINEVESNGGTPGDWTELYNPTTSAVDISNWIFRDNDTTHAYKIPAGTVIAAGGYYLLEEAAFGFGLGAPDETHIYNQYGVQVDSYSWTAHAATTYARCPNGSGAFVTSSNSTKGAANDCTPLVKINEVESSGGTPGDWIELYNAGTTTVNLGGFVLKDDDDTHNFTIPAGTTIAPGAFLVFEEAQFVFGLGAPDAARLFDPAGVLVDSYSWTAHAAVTYGRCPDGTGAFVNTAASTKGAANSCTPTGPTTAPWPGDTAVTTVDGNAVFGGNLSGLAFETAAGGNPSVMWGARNGPGSIFRLIFNGTIWTPDPANGWAAGKVLQYPDGTGEPDAEGITLAAGGSSGGIYISAERNNSNNGVSRNSVLRYDPSQAGTTLKATNEWNLTSDLPVTGANLGAEDITWIPDTILVAKGFVDESKNKAYVPADYPNHGTGIFFVGLEANGIIYAYALNHSNNTFTRVATISTGFPGVMALDYDRETTYLWATCDDGCGNLAGILEIDTNPTSATRGHFLAPRVYARPTGMPNYNNEGFTVTTSAECVNNRKPVFWADDTEDNGHAIRRGTIPCGTIAAPPAGPNARAKRGGP